MPALSITAFALSFLCLFGLSETLHVKWSIKAEYTRKMVHICTGLIVLLFPYYLTHTSVLFLCASFYFILIWSKKAKMLKGINDVNRVTKGSQYYPLAVYASFVAYAVSDQMLYYILPIVTLALADPAAAIVGQSVVSKKISVGDKNKTFYGSAAFFIVALISSIMAFYILDVSIPLYMTIVIASIATFTEMISKNGSDNITVPMAIIAVLAILSHIH
jgi:phytol kinase